MEAKIKGTTMPVLEVGLSQGEHVISAHGELSWMTPDIRMSQSTAAGGRGGLMQGLKRAAGGGGLFLTRYEGPGLVAFAAKVPGHIVPVDITQGRDYYVHRHGWVCGTAGISPSVGFQHTFRGAMFGGEGFLLQRLEGQGRAWIELSGEVTNYELPPGHTLLVHPGHVGLFEGSVQFTITPIRGISNALFGGDGFHLVALTGPGRVWLQSMPLASLAGALAPFFATSKDAAGAGAIGGMIGGMLRN
jgi:uncharacterized protein (AIM24 family)